MLVVLKEAKISHEKVTTLSDVNFTVDEGEFVYLIGKVGSGKSSILKTLYAELPLGGGTGEVLGYNLAKMKQRRIAELRRQTGIVFQDFQLLTDRTVAENLDFVLRATGHKRKAERRERIARVLDEVGLADKLDSFPHELSGGEQQRVAIARAILNEPKIILADEPTGNLDRETGKRIVGLLREAGATEVHLRIASPPITHPCFYGVDISTYDELIAAQMNKDIERIRQLVGADSLVYLSKKALFWAAGDRHELCLACFNGKYPTALYQSFEEANKDGKF